MEALRTPDDCFVALPDFPFAPNYVEVPDGDGATLRVHYLDEGPPDGPVVLLMHGEPSWCFLYRKMIPVLVEAGFRCIAPDLIGFGRSDKPTERAAYTYARHVEWMRAALFDEIDVRDATLVGQDWGGLIGLRLVAENPDRFARVVAANTFLPTGDQPPGEAFLNWQRFSQEVEDFDVGVIVGMGCRTQLTSEVSAAYSAPFPDDTYKAGARQFPMLVPTSPDDPASAANRTAWETLRAWEKPFLTAFSAKDPVTRGGDRVFQREIPGCAGQPHTTIESIEGGGHFLQEDCGEQLARVIVSWVTGKQLPRIDVIALLDEVRSIAQTGLHYATDPFDRERYEQLLALASQEYADRAGLDAADVRARFAKDVGYVTAKVGADAALFDEHDRILLVRRVDDNRWGLVAGWIDANETPEQTVVREIAEEVGLDARVDRLVGVFARPAGVDGNPHSVVSVLYLCDVIGGELRAQPHEVREIAWRAVDDVEDWHHHHETLARAAREAHWRRAAGA